MTIDQLLACCKNSTPETFDETWESYKKAVQLHRENLALVELTNALRRLKL